MARYSTGLGIEVTKILGETGIYSKGRYWEFFVDNHAASLGICDQKVKSGDQLLFANVPAKGAAEFPIVISAPAKATAGTLVPVKASYYPTKSQHGQAVGGCRASPGKGTTNAQGVATVTATKAGKLSLVGSKHGRDPLGRRDGRRLQVAQTVPRRVRIAVAAVAVALGCAGCGFGPGRRRQGRRRPGHRELRDPEARSACRSRR